MTNVNQLLQEVYDKNSKNYEGYNQYRNIPFIGWTFGQYADKMQYEENKRWWSDYEKNTGISLTDNKYPIRAGYFNYSNNSVMSSGTSQAIMNLYKKFDHKPPTINKYQTVRNYNYGDYYKNRYEHYYDWRR